MSDGGDGFGEVLGRALGAERRTLASVDAAYRPCRMRWWWEPASRTAVLESAAVIGLAMLPPRRFHPFALDTFGLGVALRKVARLGARRCLVGIGGSATNDGGFGMARALGFEFLDRAGRALQQWTELSRLDSVHAALLEPWFEEVEVAVDVSNPLLGFRGATRVYGPQKGLREGDFAVAERCLSRLARVCCTSSAGRIRLRRPINNPVTLRRTRLPKLAGAGAAGGLGFGLLVFAGARLEPGYELFAKLANVERHLRWADLVLTGEGAIDRSTIMGKGVGQIAKRCRQLDKPCIGLAGSVRLSSRCSPFTQLHALTELVAVAEAKADAAVWLDRLAQQLAAFQTLRAAP